LAVICWSFIAGDASDTTESSLEVAEDSVAAVEVEITEGREVSDVVDDLFDFERCGELDGFDCDFADDFAVETEEEEEDEEEREEREAFLIIFSKGLVFLILFSLLASLLMLLLVLSQWATVSSSRVDVYVAVWIKDFEVKVAG
jgi:hypothetical protein